MILRILICFLLSGYVFCSSSQDTLYVVKVSWHTGFLVKIDSLSTGKIPHLERYQNYNYADIGWGDKDFYMYPGNFDLFLAAKAILIPTPSVVKVTGYRSKPEKIAGWYDYTFLIELHRERYLELLDFISGYFTEEEPLKAVSKSTAYYNSKNSYWLFKTCNTWIAEGLENTGKVSSFGVISAEGLYKELLKTGKPVKTGKR